MEQIHWSPRTGETSSSSDPAPLTAADFVFAWQRAVDPSTGCPNADAFSVIQNGEAILQGQMSPIPWASRRQTTTPWWSPWKTPAVISST